MINQLEFQEDVDGIVCPVVQRGPTPLAVASAQIIIASIPRPQHMDVNWKRSLYFSGATRRKGAESTQKTMKPTNSYLVAGMLAVIDPSRVSEPDKGILAWHKAATTTNPSDGINNSITAMFAAASISPGDVASVTIGTTHFVNAVMERDANRLSKVAVIRLSGPFGKHAPPCVDWPDDMRELILGYYALAKGGLEVDGSLISDIDEGEIRTYCKEIKDRGIKSVVVNGVFSPVDTIERQEERAAQIIRDEIPGCDVVCSNEVANLGFLERENAAILNASILSFARKTIQSFQEPVKKLGLECPVFITQNDGTLLSGEMAARLPIRTFSSGPTNSMRGAAFLVGEGLNEAIMVVDIGGTTSDVGLLLANGFPRQQAAYSDLAGVRMNFSYPDVKSIALGGGSIVRKGDTMTIGPESVGYKLTKEAVVFGVQVLTTTDCIVLSDPNTTVGNRDLVNGALTEEELRRFKSIVKYKLEKVIDMMKTSPGDVPVLLYIANKSRFIVRAAGEFDYSRTDLTTVPATSTDGIELEMSAYEKTAKAKIEKAKSEFQSEADLLAYKPEVRERVWYINETDLGWISTGCYILGTGGGGSPYPDMIRLHDASVGCGGGMGSPTVGIEKLPGDEMMKRRLSFTRFVISAQHIALEIGGGNGFQGMILGASLNMDIPCIDGDWMGRAYPEKNQTTPVVFNERCPIWSPVAMADGNGNVVLIPKATSDLQVERVLRAGLSQMGSQTGCADSPVTGGEMKRWVVEHAISQAWRIGRAVSRARLTNRVDNVAEMIINDCGGPKAAKVIWKGKIVSVERTLRMGHVYGECIIEGADIVERDDPTHESQAQFKGFIKIPFKNENIAAVRMASAGDILQTEKQEDVLAIVPDLISVIDAQNGDAIGTPEYRYGLLVVVLGIAASDRWTGTQRGIEIGGPKGLGMPHLEYEPLGAFVKPVSVIDEFDQK
ncbi:hypothetical protein TrVGV298_006950 [Trichoderma virens]|nr:hypothetical protein TrVGV298_006950 [Trichoderma virens]